MSKLIELQKKTDAALKKTMDDCPGMPAGLLHRFNEDLQSGDRARISARGEALSVWEEERSRHVRTAQALSEMPGGDTLELGEFIYDLQGGIAEVTDVLNAAIAYLEEAGHTGAWYEQRMKAAWIAAEQLKQSAIDDDGTHVIVEKGALDRVIGAARRNADDARK